MPRNEDSLSFVKYRYTIDNSITVKNPTVPNIMPRNNPDRLSTTTADMPYSPRA
jgi:hypothetical protein